jgi:GAF domain-containing protein
MFRNIANRLAIALNQIWNGSLVPEDADPLPFNELQRQQAVEESHLNSDETVAAYQEIVQQAAFVCEVPIAAISVLDGDRLLFKASIGLDRRQIPRQWAFCGHAILEPYQVFQVEDASADPRFAENPLVVNDPNIRFYAGVSLVNSEGYPLGTLCVIDQVPRKLTEDQELQLKLLTQKLMIAIEQNIKPLI